MPVLESTDHITPRSALRHRLIQDDADQARAAGITPIAQRASRLRSKKTGADEEVSAWKHTTEDGNEARSGHSSTAPRPRSRLAPHPPKTPRMKRRGILPGHPLLYLGIGMIAMLALWMGLSMAVNWWNTTWDDIHYGRPRTFQVDAVVGHSDSQANPSHFIAMNLNGRIEVIELPGGDGAHARIYLGPQLYGTGADLIPVTLSFVDVKGNHLPDMILHFQNSHIVFMNDGTGFRPARSDELPAIERYLEQHGQ